MMVSKIETIIATRSMKTEAKSIYQSTIGVRMVCIFPQGEKEDEGRV